MSLAVPRCRVFITRIGALGLYFKPSLDSVDVACRVALRTISFPLLAGPDPPTFDDNKALIALFPLLF